MTDNSTDLVTVITPIYNSSLTIVETVKSLQEQDHKNWEMICVVDKGTTDNSREIITQLSNSDSRIKLHEMENDRGWGHARTYGFTKAKGKFVAFLDADDLWLPNKLASQINFMVKNNYKFTCTGYRRMSHGGNINNSVNFPPPKITYKDLLKNNSIGCLTVMLEREAIKNFRMANVPGEDYIFWLELTGRRNINCFGLQEDLARYRITENSLSRSYVKTVIQRWKVYRQFEKLSFITSLYLFINYIIAASLKRI